MLALLRNMLATSHNKYAVLYLEADTVLNTFAERD